MMPPTAREISKRVKKKSEGKEERFMSDVSVYI
jgi:hypothetical protein